LTHLLRNRFGLGWLPKCQRTIDQTIKMTPLSEAVSLV